MHAYGNQSNEMEGLLFVCGIYFLIEFRGAESSHLVI
jgi:hypothetical protein